MRKLKVLSLSHQTARLPVREQLHLSQGELADFLRLLNNRFSVYGAMVIATCNRTEVYFESDQVTTDEVVSALLRFKGQDDSFKKHFITKQNTEDAVKYLLEVASGMRSMVLGDMQIIHQIKRAFQVSTSLGLQGKLLERAIQATLKMHKRIHNETKYRSGTASMSYLGLTVCKQIFGKQGLHNKSMLVVGAGEISREVVKYARKFHFKKVAITNRTKAKAVELANEYDYDVEDWSDLQEKSLKDYDVIVTGVSNCSHLFENNADFQSLTQQKVFIDLGVPANVDEALGRNDHITVVDVDNLYERTYKVQEERMEAVTDVNTILLEELQNYQKWVQKVPVNESLGMLKNYLKGILQTEITTHFGEQVSIEMQEKFIKRVSNEFLKRPAVSLHRHPQNQAVANSLQELFA